MKRTYHKPSTAIYVLHPEALLISVSTGESTPGLTPDEGEGDASDALVKGETITNEWNW